MVGELAFHMIQSVLDWLGMLFALLGSVFCMESGSGGDGCMGPGGGELGGIASQTSPKDANNLIHRTDRIV